MREIFVLVWDFLSLIVSDFLHPEQKAAREALEARAKAQDEAIERHEAIDKVLTSESRELDQKIADDEAKLDDILTRPIDSSGGLRDKL